MTEVTIVLVEPEKPWNIGSIARLMNNFGIANLHIVTHLTGLHLHEKARVLAVNSLEQLQAAQTFETMPQAIAGHDLVIATTARRRGLVASTSSHDLVEALQGGSYDRVALVFGRETSGLTNDEVSLCNMLVHIPTMGSSGSLNLSKAVAVILYEFSKLGSAGPVRQRSQKARPEEIRDLQVHLQKTLNGLGFARNYDQSFIRRSLNNMLYQASLSGHDTRLLHKILRAFHNQDQ